MHLHVTTSSNNTYPTFNSTLTSLYRWFANIYMLEKLVYNMYHSYTTIIPLTGYIFFRNMTPWLRGFNSGMLHNLGKTTLETYLLQHHLWLTSNAKTLLTLVPNHRWINFLLCSALFFTVAKELYRLTMSLRGMILPDDPRIAWRNLLGMTGVLSAYYAVGFLVSLAIEPTALDGVLVSLAIFVGLLFAIDRFGPNSNLNPNPNPNPKLNLTIQVLYADFTTNNTVYLSNPPKLVTACM